MTGETIVETFYGNTETPSIGDRLRRIAEAPRREKRGEIERIGDESVIGDAGAGTEKGKRRAR